MGALSLIGSTVSYAQAIEIRSVETGHLDGVFMHKKAQKLKFLCERNDKVQKQFCSEKVR
jgi:hypothetical protein